MQKYIKLLEAKVHDLESRLAGTHGEMIKREANKELEVIEQKIESVADKLKVQGTKDKLRRGVCILRPSSISIVLVIELIGLSSLET